MNRIKQRPVASDIAMHSRPAGPPRRSVRLASALKTPLKGIIAGPSKIEPSRCNGLILWRKISFREARSVHPKRALQPPGHFFDKF
jgi:hypothetical protein